MEYKIIQIIKSINESANIPSGTTDLFTSGVLDSFGIAQLIGALEEEFSIEIDPEDILPENFSTVNEIVTLLRRYK